MGVEALITNAYIFSQSKQYSERVKEEGLHKLLDFDGVIMTDSRVVPALGLRAGFDHKRGDPHLPARYRKRHLGTARYPHLPGRGPRDRGTGTCHHDGTAPRGKGTLRERCTDCRAGAGKLYPTSASGRERKSATSASPSARSVRSCRSWSPTGTGTSWTWSLPQNARSPARPASTSFCAGHPVMFRLPPRWAAIFLIPLPTHSMQKRGERSYYAREFRNRRTRRSSLLVCRLPAIRQNHSAPQKTGPASGPP